MSRLPVWISIILGAAAASAFGFGVWIALGRADTEALESPLALAIARQLEHGPWELYGPFTAGNHLVLIHASLYYHTAAVIAWLLARLGIEPVSAALAAGRSISLGGLLFTLWATYRLCRLDGATRRAGWWALCLVAASPVVGVMPFTVRPDMLGVALQTLGVVLVLSALRPDGRKTWLLPVGFAAFGLALGTKQHLITGPLVSTGLALLAWWRRRLAFRVIERGLLVFVAVSLALYGIEEFATGGRMGHAAFRAAAAANGVHPGGWSRTYLLMFSITGRSGGLAMLAIAAGLAGLKDRPGRRWKWLTIAGTGLIGVFVARCILDFRRRIEGPRELQLAFLMITTTMFIALPACVFQARRVLARHWLDRILVCYLACELVLILVLGGSSTGSWANYGIQAIVFASVLTARALDRACALRPSLWGVVPIAAALLVVLIAVFSTAWNNFIRQHLDHVAIQQIGEHFGRPWTEYFFVGRPGENRVNGRLDLVYDDWLYPVFESVRLAEPRSIWLRQTLTDGSVRFVVNTSDATEIDGIGEPMRTLGFVRRIRHGRFFVWERINVPIAGPRVPPRAGGP